ncbi:DUF6799 domain-containing protein [Hymenobacter sp. CRA2]|uniref:DUF6799 domain-containing protein n=1 Tax=Hymenobacter sp. CRA2 TaxID=1955620 RepID=UPI00098F31EC|nr:DUF6799 domain-containing protein [Hymenobacter sp. CRA2]OON70569.1 hypothetical protein B0919_00660 [Hymenobacter sp. CRA2]
MRRFLLTLILLASALLTYAQSTAYSLKDGAFRESGVVMRLQAGQARRLEGPLTLNDGSVMNPTGILVRKDGTRQLLPNGQAVNMQGVVVNLRDDMQSAQAIEQRNRQVAGGRGEISITTGGSTVSTATAEQLRQLERRVALLQKLTDRLADRTSQAVGNAPGTSGLDEQLRALEAQR